jgi:hypothetical protein
MTATKLTPERALELAHEVANDEATVSFEFRKEATEAVEKVVRRVFESGPSDVIWTRWASLWLSGADRLGTDVCHAADDAARHAKSLAIDEGAKDRWSTAAWRAAKAALHLSYGDHNGMAMHQAKLATEALDG